MGREIIITGNADSERQTVLGFLSFVDANFESLDMCILLGIPTDMRKLVRSHEKFKKRETEDRRQGVKLKHSNEYKRVKWVGETEG